jgi:hypothetical protein
VQSAYFSWQHAILKSQLKPTTKHVCLTIGCHMAADGSGCFPSYATIAEESGLSRRAVIEHVCLAIEEGYLQLDQRFRDNGSHSSNLYLPIMPEGGAPASPGGERPALGGGERRAPLLTDQSSNRPSDNTPISPQRFDDFWGAWPTHERKRDRRRCEELWRRANLDASADVILLALGLWKMGAEWKRDRGKYIPAPLVWLRNERWENPPPQTEPLDMSEVPY